SAGAPPHAPARRPRTNPPRAPPAIRLPSRPPRADPRPRRGGSRQRLRGAGGRRRAHADLVHHQVRAAESAHERLEAAPAVLARHRSGEEDGVPQPLDAHPELAFLPGESFADDLDQVRGFHSRSSSTSAARRTSASRGTCRSTDVAYKSRLSRRRGPKRARHTRELQSSSPAARIARAAPQWRGVSSSWTMAFITIRSSAGTTRTGTSRYERSVERRSISSST